MFYKANIWSYTDTNESHFQDTVKRDPKVHIFLHTNTNENTLQGNTKNSDESNKSSSLPAALWNKQVLMFKSNA